MILAQFWRESTCIFWVLNQKMQMIQISIFIHHLNNESKIQVHTLLFQRMWLLQKSLNLHKSQIKCFDIIIIDYILAPSHHRHKLSKNCRRGYFSDFISSTRVKVCKSLFSLDNCSESAKDILIHTVLADPLLAWSNYSRNSFANLLFYQFFGHL